MWCGFNTVEYTLGVEWYKSMEAVTKGIPNSTTMGSPTASSLTSKQHQTTN